MLPYAFTEQGVAMLSSVLNTDSAIEANVLIMRAFVQLRELLTAQEQFARKLAVLEKKLVDHDQQLAAVFEAIRQLMAPPPPGAKRVVGFVDEQSAPRKR